MAKDATITVRVPRLTRRRLEALARREGRSLSQQIGRLIDAALAREEDSPANPPEPRGSLAGLLAREPLPEYADFRAVRTVLSASLLRAAEGHGSADR